MEDDKNVTQSAEHERIVNPIPSSNAIAGQAKITNADGISVTATVNTASNLTLYARKGDQRHAIEIDASADVSELRARVAQAFAQAPEHITLIYAGRILQDGATLERANIQDKHAVHAVVRQPRLASQSPAQQPPHYSHQTSATEPPHAFGQMLHNVMASIPLFMAEATNDGDIQFGAVQFADNFDNSQTPRNQNHHQLHASHTVFVFDGNQMVPIAVDGVGNMHPESIVRSAENAPSGNRQIIDDDLFADGNNADGNSAAPSVIIQQELVLIPANMLPESAGNISTAPGGGGATNDQLREFLEAHPELTHALNNRDSMHQTLQAARNPALMREMMRNHDRALSNLEALPGGLTALERYYNEYQRPMMDAAQPGEIWSQGQQAQHPNFPFFFPLTQQHQPAHAQNGSSNVISPVRVENHDPLPDAWQNSSAASGLAPSGEIVIHTDSNFSSSAAAIAQALGIPGGAQNPTAQAMNAVISQVMSQAEANGGGGNNHFEFSFHINGPDAANINSTPGAVLPQRMPSSSSGGGDADNNALSSASSMPGVQSVVPKPSGSLASGGARSNRSNTASTAQNQPGQAYVMQVNADGTHTAYPLMHSVHLPQVVPAHHSHLLSARLNERTAGQAVCDQQHAVFSAATQPGAAHHLNAVIIAEALRLVTDRRALAALHVLHVLAPTIFPVDPLGILLHNGNNDNNQHQQQQQQMLLLHEQQRMNSVQPPGSANPHHHHFSQPHFHHPLIRQTTNNGNMSHAGHHFHHHHHYRTPHAHAGNGLVCAAHPPPANTTNSNSPHPGGVVRTRLMAGQPVAAAPMVAPQQQAVAGQQQMGGGPFVPIFLNAQQAQAARMNGVHVRLHEAPPVLRFTHPLHHQQQQQMRPVGAPESHDEHNFRASLNALSNMGFRNSEANRRALIAANFNVPDAIRRLNEDPQQGAGGSGATTSVHVRGADTKNNGQNNNESAKK